MDIPMVTSGQLADLLPMTSAIDALEEAFRSSPLPETPTRSHLDVGAGDLLLMPSWNDRSLGVKLVTVNPSNPGEGLPLINGLYILFSQRTLQPIAAFDAAALTAIRTAAVSAVATRFLARPDVDVLVIFGAGTQARHHIAAMLAVRDPARVVIVSRTRERAEACLQLARELGVEGVLGNPDDVGEADLVCTCTSSPSPVFDGEMLAAGTHVNAVGAYKRSTRELDSRAVERGLLVVETRAAALAEAGDILIPLEEGIIGEDAIVADLSEVVGGTEVRRSPDDVTIFKSVGVAFEDLVVAAAAYERV